MEWYSVKSLYRWAASGAVRAPDGSFVDDIALLEERVVLFRVGSAEEALQEAELEAEKYCLEKYQNPYGQTVTISSLGCFDSYLLPDEPNHATEAYSSTRIVRKSLADKKLINRCFGKEEGRKTREKRAVFSNAGPVE